MKIGFIGTGNMGTILIEALIESKAAIPSSLTITNRTIDKALNIKSDTRAFRSQSGRKKPFPKARPCLFV